jgi:hypothetical protein
VRPRIARRVVRLCALTSLVVPVVGRADARAAKAARLHVEVSPLQNPDPLTGPTIVVAAGGVWSVSDMGAAVETQASSIARSSAALFTPWSR